MNTLPLPASIAETTVGQPGSCALQLSFGRYEVLCKLASGGMGSVYLARTRGVGGFERIVAIKCCHPHLRADRDLAMMFLDEARLAAKIHHPNVVATLDVGDDTMLYLVMEYIEGGRLADLSHALAAGERIPIPLVLRILVDTLTGLHAAHEICDARGQPLNLVHRDVTPHNILVGADGATRITDFGIVRAESRATTTPVGCVKGSEGYMAPELFRSTPITRQADVFSAGVVLWELLTGSPLFHAETDIETFVRTLQAVVPVPSSIVSDVPPALNEVTLKALTRDETRRYATAAEFAVALEQSGVPCATTREMSVYVEERLGAELSRQRELLRRLQAAPERPLNTVSDGPAVSRTLFAGEDLTDVETYSPFESVPNQPSAPASMTINPGASESLSVVTQNPAPVPRIPVKPRVEEVVITLPTQPRWALRYASMAGLVLFGTLGFRSLRSRTTGPSDLPVVHRSESVAAVVQTAPLESPVAAEPLTVVQTPAVTTPATQQAETDPFVIEDPSVQARPRQAAPRPTIARNVDPRRRRMAPPSSINVLSHKETDANGPPEGDQHLEAQPPNPRTYSPQAI